MADIGFSVLDDAGILHVRCLDDVFVVYTSTTQMWAAVETAISCLQEKVWPRPGFD